LAQHRRNLGGYRADELIGRPARMLQSSATSPLVLTELDTCVAKGGIWRGEFSSQRKDGSEFVESAMVASIRLADGRTSHYVTITEDITERKHDALELDRHRHALEALVETRTQELAVAKLAVEDANVAQSAFLANMSHEIRTPLSAILGFTCLIRRTRVTAQQAEWLTQLDTAGAHLLELINAVLDLSKSKPASWRWRSQRSMPWDSQAASCPSCPNVRWPSS
jgi:two-component system, sensor histidine kinase and response regulator